MYHNILLHLINFELFSRDSDLTTSVVSQLVSDQTSNHLNYSSMNIMSHHESSKSHQWVTNESSRVTTNKNQSQEPLLRLQELQTSRSRVINESSRVNYQMRSSINWHRLSNEIDCQLRLTIDWYSTTIDWNPLSTEIHYRLKSTINWDWPLTEIDNPLYIL